MHAAILNGVNVSSARLVGAQLDASSAVGTYFADSDLSNAQITFGQWENANLTHANLSNASLEGTDFRGANMSNVIYNNTLCPDKTNSDDNGGTCSGHGGGL
jgi:uncharacterized protein YjbI with pentapeptide repeats